MRTLEQRILRRTRIVLAVNLAAAVSGVVLLVGGLAYLVTGHQQTTTADRLLTIAASTDRPGIRYSCLWLFTLRQEQWGGVVDAPPGFPLRDSMRAVEAGGNSVDETVTANDTIYRVRTELVEGTVRQAVFDTAYLQENHRQLLISLMVSGLAGLIGAAIVGAALSYRAIDPLAEALERQRRFVADASHELRAPLTRLHTRAQLILRRNGELPEPLTAELRQLAEGTRELGEVVDDLLRSARLRSSMPDSERVDLPLLVADVLAAESGRLKERELTATVEVTGEHTVVAGVPSSLRRMVSALVDNAIGHTLDGGRIEATIGTTDNGRMVELVVADDGVGLDPSIRDVIFERYTRGTAGIGERHGIGLALAREVVDGHGGTISAAARPEYGTEFTVRLPVAARSDSETVLKNGRDAGSGAASDTGEEEPSVPAPVTEDAQWTSSRQEQPMS